MPRNLDRRVEALVQITRPEHQRDLDRVIDYALRDDWQSWELQSDSTYVLRTERTFQAHGAFELRARRRSGVDREPNEVDTPRRPAVRARPALVLDGGGPLPDQTPTTVDVKAAGCVVVRGLADDLRVALVHRPRYDDWSFPKGKVDPGESEFECALREVLEETGIEGIPGPELPMVAYLDHQQRRKTVRYWLLEYARGTFVPNDEVDVLLWAGVAEARRLLSYEHDRAVLESAVERTSR